MSDYHYQLLEHLHPFARTSETQGGTTAQTAETDWAKFRGLINNLVIQCEHGEQIKVVFLARHGQAMHNLLADETGLSMYEAQKRFGHPDPQLSPGGREQATGQGNALRHEVGRRMPVPERSFVSSLRRTGEACRLHWDWLFSSTSAFRSPRPDVVSSEAFGVPAEVVEEWRERLHVQVCNRRSSLTELKAAFPYFSFPANMAEEDPMWLEEGARQSETPEELVARIRIAMDKTIEQSGDAIYLSITTHGQVIKHLNQVLGGPSTRLALGKMSIIVLKVKKVES